MNLPYAGNDCETTTYTVCDCSCAIWGARQLTLFGKLLYASTALCRHCLMQAHSFECLVCLMEALPFTAQGKMPYAGTALYRHIHLNALFALCRHCLSQALPFTGNMMHTQTRIHISFSLSQKIQSSLASPQPEPLQHPPPASKIVAQVHRTASFCNCLHYPSDRSNERLVPV